MSEGAESIARAAVVLRVRSMESVIVRRNIPYGPAGADRPVLDVRYPGFAQRRGGLPAVVFVTGYADAGAVEQFGAPQKDMRPLASWAELVAASGLTAVTYSNHDPAADVHTLLEHLEQHGAALGVDPSRIGLWACSGNVPNALSVLLGARGRRLACAVFCYGFMLDLEGSDDVERAAAEWGFVHPCAGRAVEELPDDVPIYIARAGQDVFPGLNASIDRFVTRALAANKPITLTNIPGAPHAFDLFHDTDASREAVRDIVSFMRFNMLGC